MRGAGVDVVDEVGVGLEELVAADAVRQPHLVHLRQPCAHLFVLVQTVRSYASEPVLNKDRCRR